MLLEFMLYSSKNYLFPLEQLYPHSRWQDSVGPLSPPHAQDAFLRSYFPSDCGALLGPSMGDHVFLFSHSLLSPSAQEFFASSLSSSLEWVDVPVESAQLVPGEKALDCFMVPGSPVSMSQPSFCEGGLDCCFFNMMMYDMAPEVAEQFFNDGAKTAQSVTVGARAGCDA